ncbi:MAG TPA: isopentenyl-diphosphate Delta-isomerase [Cytophagaceae bacterium]|jgi:isopentenyl-diphosphate delta-isomerase|nr:isopentenyl-diphosphate Delta-isomerase [Cytophagaceae bacterium]
MEKVILVDELDQEAGFEEKMEAHRQGLLHRAFSVFVFNNAGQLLLQQRAAHKYHSPLLWSNTCCSHPRPGEKTIDAAHRRCKEEMGIDPVLVHAFSFIYKVALDQGLTEHEYDHVYIGIYNEAPLMNPEEVTAFKWANLSDVKKDITLHPHHYTAWFAICLDQVIEHYKKNEH